MKVSNMEMHTTSFKKKFLCCSIMEVGRKHIDLLVEDSTKYLYHCNAK